MPNNIKEILKKNDYTPKKYIDDKTKEPFVGWSKEKLKPNETIGACDKCDKSNIPVRPRSKRNNWQKVYLCRECRQDKTF